MIQIVINILIGWEQSSQVGENGIFGIPLAYADCCEEQARYTLHSHISIWIKNFNGVRDLLFHENAGIRQKAKDELENYFQMIAQASFHDLYDVHPSDTSLVNNINSVLEPTNDQDLRKMRHHIHCKDLH